ncbi:MAG: Lrp/AsnC ligand binding domain-containing protein [Candidatus Odinarchaeota archaeon]
MTEKIGAFINITTEHMEPDEILDIIVREINPEEIYFVTGDYDYILKVNVSEMNELRDLVSRLRKFTWIKKTNTSIILRKLG